MWEQYETCDRGFTLRLLSEYRGELRARRRLELAVARKWGKVPRPFAETKAAYLNGHAMRHAGAWTDTEFCGVIIIDLD